VERQQRRSLVQAALREDPFLTDRELAERLAVSVQTIRLDRLALGIPEMRARALGVAEEALGHTRLLLVREVFGEMLDIEPGQRALSRLVASREMAFHGSDRVEGHFLYAQAETLALAVAEVEPPVIPLARVRFRRGVAVGETLVCKATVIRRGPGRQVVLSVIRAGGDEVFRGKFEVLAGEG